MQGKETSLTNKYIVIISMLASVLLARTRTFTLDTQMPVGWIQKSHSLQWLALSALVLVLSDDNGHQQKATLC